LQKIHEMHDERSNEDDVITQ